MNREFLSYALNEQGKAKARAIAEAFDTLLTKLQGIPPIEREAAVEAVKKDPFFPRNATEEILREWVDALVGPADPGLCPPSRELSIVKTKLEEACFFAKKAMASQPENQEVP